MTIKEAIALLTQMQRPHPPLHSYRRDTALALAIEALKKYQDDKKIGCIRTDFYLPGEYRDPYIIL